MFMPKICYFQVDLFFMPDEKYKVGMIMVDIFTKYTEVIPIMDKTDGSILAALMEGFKQDGRQTRDNILR